MAGEAAGEKLGRLIGRARALRPLPEIVGGSRGPRRPAPVQSEGNLQGDSTMDEPAVVDVDLSDALERAERAEAEVVRLRAELAHKEEILTEARLALRTARLALRDHLRIIES